MYNTYLYAYQIISPEFWVLETNLSHNINGSILQLIKVWWSAHLNIQEVTKYYNLFSTVKYQGHESGQEWGNGW